MTSVLDINISETSYEAATQRIQNWSARHESRYVCAANVHMLMEAYDSPAFAGMVNNADLVTPDGMPLVWMMRAKGCRGQGRVYGPTLMLSVLKAAARENLAVGFYGGRLHVLEKLVNEMQARFPKLNIVFSCSPSFDGIGLEEEAEVVEKINQSGTQILFVGLGCPKQEIWMAQHHDRVQAVMIGVGAAFDFHAGRTPQAPAWMQRLGLEWFFRLLMEPRRLWWRYLYHNPRFVWLAIADLLGFLKKAS
jgi:N-acetylglucosaminyldiphosphoundecaprenol N-acetyl-beta-D-mannosaminyltransferase